MQKVNLIWDLDGTLIDSKAEVLECLKKAINASGVDEKDAMSTLRVGPTIDVMLNNAFSTKIVTEKVKSEIIKNFRLIYDNSDFSKTFLFSGIKNILQNENFIHHIVTNKPDLPTKRILQKLEISQYFKTVITPYTFQKNATVQKQTKTELFTLIKNQHQGESFIGIGDMASDCIAAVNSGIIAFGVLWGEGKEQELQSAGCTALFNNSEKLLNRLLEDLYK